LSDEDVPHAAASGPSDAAIPKTTTVTYLFLMKLISRRGIPAA